MILTIAADPNITETQLLPSEATEVASDILNTINTGFHPRLPPRQALSENAGLTDYQQSTLV